MALPSTACAAQSHRCSHPPMREALAPQVSMLLAGVVEPDFHRVVSHKIPIISLGGTPPPRRTWAPDAFTRFATNAEEMFRLGRAWMR